MIAFLAVGVVFFAVTLVTGSTIKLGSLEATGTPAAILSALAIAFCMSVGMTEAVRFVRKTPMVELTRDRLIASWFPGTLRIDWANIVAISEPVTTKWFSAKTTKIRIVRSSGRSISLLAEYEGVTAQEFHRRLVDQWLASRNL